MTAEIKTAALQLLKVEAEVAFATENAVHSWQDVRAIDPVLTRSQQMLRRKHRLQRLAMHPDFNLGRKGGGLTFGHELVGATTPLTTGAAAADDTLGLLLKTCLGNTYAAAGSDVVAAPGPTTTVFSVTPGHGARFRAGTVIMVALATGNEMSVIKEVNTDAITLEFALSAAPATGADIWNSYSYYIDPSQSATLQALLVGEATADVWLALGLVGGVTFQNLLQLEEVASAQFDLPIVQWDEDTIVGGLAAGSYDEAGPSGTSDEMELHVQDDGTTTRNLISASAIDLNPNVAWTQHHARGAAEHEHVARVRQLCGAAVGSGPTASMTVDIDDDFRADWEGKTKKMVCLMAGRTAGAAWAIVMPRAQIVNPPERGAHNEMTSYALQLEAHENDAGPDSSGLAAATALMRSPIVVCRL